MASTFKQKGGRVDKEVYLFSCLYVRRNAYALVSRLKKSKEAPAHDGYVMTRLNERTEDPLAKCRLGIFPSNNWSGIHNASI